MMSGWQGEEQLFILSYPTGTQKLYMPPRDRSLKLNAAAQTMNSDVLLTMM